MSKQISQLDSTNELNDNDIFPVVNDNTTKKLSFTNLKTLLAQLFITNETDPTVPSWAKASKKPSYSTSELTNDSGFVTKEVNDLTNYELKTKTGSTIEFSIDNTTHNITLKLKNSNGDILSEKTIQLENFVTESDFSTFTTQLNQVLQSLNETKADAEDVEALQTRVTELEQENEDLKKNQLTNTPEISTSHYLQDSADSRFRKFIPIGRTTQESTSGKNKFSSELELGSIDNSTGLPSSSAANTCLRTKDYISVQPSTTYTIKNNKGYYTFLYFYQEDKTYISYSRNTTDTLTFTTDSNTYFIKLRTASDRNENDITAKYMLNTGSTAEPYEPYTGGEPAPNPIYVIPYKNTGDNVNLLNIAESESGGIDSSGNLISGETFWRSTNFIAVKPNTAMYISANQNILIRAYFYDKDKNFISPRVEGDSSRNYLSFTTGANIYYIKWSLFLTTGLTQEIVNSLDLKLEQGTKATPYSPYGCGNVNEKVQNKNLFDENAVTFTTGVLDDNGNPTGSTASHYTNNFYQVTPNTNYTLKGTLNTGSSSGRIYYYDKDKKWISRSESFGSNQKTFTTPEKCYYIKIQVVVSITLKTGDVQLEEGTTATPYQPHEEQNISFPLAQGQKFYEGSHPDDDEKVHHKMREIVLDGVTEGLKFTTAEPNRNNRFILNLSDIKQRTYTENSYMKSSHFLYNTTVYFDSQDQVGFCANNLGLFVRFGSSSEINTITKANNWLAEHLPKFQYELAEETTEDFTEEQKEAYPEWKKARTYKNVTHISSEDETPANAEIEYVRDINTIDDRITALEAKVDLLEE